MNQIVFTVGADPEIFVKKDGKAVTAHGLVAGTKDAPLKTSKGAVQVDGMALEFNIDPVAIALSRYADFHKSNNDWKQFNTNVVDTIKDLKNLVKKSGVTFNIAPVQDFDEEYLKEVPEEALELGCNPDWNAYTKQVNPTPNAKNTFRTGAGHVHIGWGSNIPVDNPQHIEICANFIKELDRTVGLFMAYIDREPRRRELYGKAGAFRPKPYGVEYRTPSNEWIVNADRREMMWKLINIAINLAKFNKTKHEGQLNYEGFFWPSTENARKIIDTGNYKEAHKWLAHNFRYDNTFRNIVKSFNESIDYNSF